MIIKHAYEGAAFDSRVPTRCEVNRPRIRSGGRGAPGVILILLFDEVVCPGDGREVSEIFTAGSGRLCLFLNIVDVMCVTYCLLYVRFSMYGCWHGMCLWLVTKWIRIWEPR